MWFDDIEIADIHSLIETVRLYSSTDVPDRLPLWFRGCTDSDYSLVPSIGRGRFRLQHERMLINGFKQNAIQFLDHRPSSEWEWIFLARHYAVPTRLLDWSESPFIGLYFATHSLDEADKNDHKDGALWVLSPHILNSYAGIHGPNSLHLPMFEDRDVDLKSYLPSTLSLEETSNMNPMAGIGVRNSKRMQAQQSVFTVTHRDPIAINNVGDNRHVGRCIVPKDRKRKIRDEMALLMFHRLSVFPELDNAAWLATETLR